MAAGSSSEDNAPAMVRAPPLPAPLLPLTPRGVGARAFPSEGRVLAVHLKASKERGGGRVRGPHLLLTPASAPLVAQHPQRAAAHNQSAGDDPEPHDSPEATEPSKRATPIHERVRARGTLAAPDLFHPDEPLRVKATGTRHVRRPESAMRTLANARAQCNEQQARLDEDRAQLDMDRAQFKQILADLQPALMEAAAQQAEVERLSTEGSIRTRGNATCNHTLDGGHRQGQEADAGDLAMTTRQMHQCGVGQMEVDHESPPPRQPTLLESMKVLAPATCACFLHAVIPNPNLCLS